MNFILNGIFEPKTKLYDLEELEKTNLIDIERIDLDIVSSRNKIIKSSYWKKKNSTSKNIIIILCGNMGNRLSALYLLKHFIPKDISLAIMEYNGRGHSERLPISYSHHEKNDINIFVETLNKEHNFNNFALWGRSMGASTTLAYYEKFHFLNKTKLNYNLKAVIVDSPFLSLEKVLQTKLKSIFFVSLFNKSILNRIKNHTKQKYDFTIEEISIFHQNIENKEKIKNEVPFRVIGSPEDELCDFKYINEFFELLDGDKELIQVTGNHAFERSIEIIEDLSNFIEKELKNN